MSHRLGEIAVVRQDEEPFAVFVETTHRKEPPILKIWGKYGQNCGVKSVPNGAHHPPGPEGLTPPGT